MTAEDVVAALAAERNTPNIVIHGESWNNNERFYFKGVRYDTIDEAKKEQNAYRMRAALTAALTTGKDEG